MPKQFRLPMILVHTPFLWVEGLTLFPWVFCKEAHPPKWLLNHERIHLCQQLELGIFLFYFWYLTEYLIRLVQYRRRYLAYRNISFEREAYRNDRDLTYLKTRRIWSFLKYL
ncbi:hypothetical protein [Runella slithyformis]|uniref:DUF4157 domain-containing protein n=1 Tax=Runella slithyformis (strain ATCC 29530 / DSM 19594 / LMG 11500 / NCIMB 11436 / LSU 4) TaxID=761193 RepID=A0A7U3ZGA2_RUNSL|nr:hypothetical protein [Runella slithyformis]AEI46681.1 hypothetical protein Runsl_0225 [Runella slithyformis DSM 19594]